jgi:hypothetical protein
MAYIINKFNGDQAAVVEDGTINTTLDLKLIGKNYAGYGEAQNENYTWLLENFASQTAPPKAIIGQLWYQTTTQKLKVNYGTGVWHNVGINDVVSSISAATGLTQGDLFWVTDQQQLWCKGATENVLIGGKLTNVATQMKSTTVTSNAVPTVSYEIIEAVINGVTAFVVSSAATMFTLATAEPLKAVGFSNIYPGITVKGFSSTNNDSTDYKYWGSASNSDRLGGALASAYVTKSGAIFSDIAKFATTGFSVGPADSEILAIFNTDSTPIIQNSASSTIQFKTTVSGSRKFPMTLVGPDILPGTPNTNGSNIGSAGEKFNNVYALTFNGNATSASGLVLSGSTLSPSIAPTAGTIPARSSAAEILTNLNNYSLPAGSIQAVEVVANNFVGNASSATGLKLSTVTITPSIAATANTIPVRSAAAEILTNLNDYSLPAGSIKAVEVLANNFVGNASSATGVVLGTDVLVPVATSATLNTLVARTKTDDGALPAGSIIAVKVKTTSTNAIYADLAENYISDNQYDIGTVVMIGGTEEVTAALAGYRALGVVSANPAYLMNCDLENGTPIALKGRVPVKVTGSVKKGDRLIASSVAGFATALTSSADAEFVFAISLTDNENEVVEAVII